MCGLQIRPWTDVDPLRVKQPSVGNILSRCPGAISCLYCPPSQWICDKLLGWTRARRAAQRVCGSSRCPWAWHSAAAGRAASASSRRRRTPPSATRPPPPTNHVTAFTAQHWLLRPPSNICHWVGEWVWSCIAHNRWEHLMRWKHQ